MHIFFDHQIFSLQKVGGVSRYIHELSDRLSSKSDTNVLLYAPYSENIYCPGNRFPSILPWRIRQVGYYGINSLLTKAHVKDVEIYHPSYYGLDSVPSSYRKIVVTVYDLIHEKYRTSVGVFDQTVKAKSRIINKADAVIAISNSTKLDLIDIYGVEERKIHVIYPGVTVPAALKETILPDRFILYVGNRRGYKNFEFYIRSVAGTLITRDVRLVAFGGGTFSADELRIMKELGIANRVTHLYGEDETLFFCYKRAMFTVFPSILEGFGFPIVEAFSMGCPVLTGDASSMAEIAQDSALLADPLKADEWKRCTESIIDDAGIRSELSARGLDRVKDFSWDRAADQTLELYKSL